MQFLLDFYDLPADDIELNKKVLVWSKQISPIFDHNDEVGAACKTVSIYVIGCSVDR